MLVIAVVCLIALLATTGWTLTARRPAPAHLLGALAVAWLFANAAMEGPVLWTLSPGHGLVLADLLTPAAVLLAAWRLWTLRRTRAVAPRSVESAGTDVPAGTPQR